MVKLSWGVFTTGSRDISDLIGRECLRGTLELYRVQRSIPLSRIPYQSVLLALLTSELVLELLRQILQLQCQSMYLPILRSWLGFLSNERSLNLVFWSASGRDIIDTVALLRSVASRSPRGPVQSLEATQITS